jgi:hypothetical protein
MQLRLPLVAPSTGQHTLAIAGRVLPVTIARHRRARRYILRVSSDGGLRLTVPRGASVAGGLRFAETQARWIERERVRQEQRIAEWRHGTTTWYRGVRETLSVTATTIVLGDVRIERSDARESIRDAVEARLTSMAARELPGRCAELAKVHGFSIARVSVRNQRSRWGACSPRRVITLNWRLVLMPPAVSDYVLLHELAHLVQPNHSRRFWREVERICPWWRDAERWLRRHGKELI